MARAAVNILIFTLFIALGHTQDSSGQGDAAKASPYFIQPQYDPYLEYAIHSGRLQLNQILNQPYTAAQIASGFSGIRERTDHGLWFDILSRDLSRFNAEDSTDAFSGHWLAGMNGQYRMISKNRHPYTQYRLELYGYYSLPYLTLANRTVTDQHFKDDVSYTGDTGEWIQGRVEDAYLRIHYRALSLFAGRITRNFGIINEPSLILSTNPYSYDHFGFDISTRRFSYAYYTSRLNDLIAYDVQTNDPTPRKTKRYFAVQRGELSLLNNLHIGFSEVVVYGGENQNFEAIYLNPLNFYYVAQRNHKVQMNGLWAFEVYYKPFRKLVLYNQLLIDDLIINNEPGQNDRDAHPDRLGITSKTIVTDLIAPGTQIDLSYTRIGNWTYMSYRTWENYMSESKSMGYPQNSVESIALGLGYFGHPPFMFQLKTGLKRHGDQDMRNPFGDSRDKFPIATIEKTTYTDLSIRYLPSYRFHAQLKANWASIRNEHNIPGRSANNFAISLILYSALSIDFMY